MRGDGAFARGLTFLLFLLLVGIVAYWSLQLLAPRPAIAPSGSVGDSTAALNLSPTAMLFGSRNAATATAEAPTLNIQVNGIVEAGPNGVAILTVDGRPAAAFAVNQPVSDNARVRSVSLDSVVIEQRGRSIELKAPERGSVAVLSSGVGRSGPASTPGARNPTPPLPLPPTSGFNTQPPGSPGYQPATPLPAPFNRAPGQPAPEQPGTSQPAAGPVPAPAVGAGPNITPGMDQVVPGQPAFPVPQATQPGVASPNVRLSQPPGRPAS